MRGPLPLQCGEGPVPLAESNPRGGKHMSLYRPFTNGKIGVVDLTTRSAYTVDLSEDALPGSHRRGVDERTDSFGIRKRQPRLRDRTADRQFRPGLGPSRRDVPIPPLGSPLPRALHVSQRPGAEILGSGLPRDPRRCKGALRSIRRTAANSVFSPCPTRRESPSRKCCRCSSGPHRGSGPPS